MKVGSTGAMAYEDEDQFVKRCSLASRKPFYFAMMKKLIKWTGMFLKGLPQPAN